MYATYLRLRVTVHASAFTVARKALLRIRREARFSWEHRQARRDYVARMLGHHHEAQRLVRIWKL